MRIRHSLIFLLALVISAFAQEANKQPSVIMAPVGKVQVHAGGTATVEMAFRVGEGFHVNSNKPHSDLLIPTVLKLNPPAELAVALVKYPPGKDETFPFSPKDKLNVYSGDFIIDASLKAPAKTAAGNYPVSGQLTFQACDRSACFPPKSIPVQFQVTVVK